MVVKVIKIGIKLQGIELDVYHCTKFEGKKEEEEIAPQLSEHKPILKLYFKKKNHPSRVPSLEH